MSIVCEVNIGSYYVNLFMDNSLVVVKGLVQLSGAMNAMQDHLRWTSHSEEFWQTVIRWRRTWWPTPVFLPWEPHDQYEKTKTKTNDGRKWTPYESFK